VDWRRWLSPSGAVPPIPSLRATLGPLLILIPLAFAVRWPYIAAADCIDSDSAIQVLMARHFARGEPSLYIWGQSYMGAVDAMVLTPLALVGAATPWASTIVAVTLVAAIMVLVALLARRWGAIPWLASLLVAGPGSFMALNTTFLYGARLSALLWVLGAMLCLAPPVDPTKAPGPRPLRAGALLGLAGWADHLMVVWMVAAAIYVWPDRRRLVRLVLGALPFLLVDLVASRCLSAVVKGNGPVAFRLWPRNFYMLGRAVLPKLLGWDWLASGFGTRPVAATWYWMIAAGIALAGLCVLVVHAGRCRRAGPTAPLLAVVVGTGAAFTMVAQDIFAVRYLLPALPAAALLLAKLATHVKPALRSAIVALPLCGLLSVWHEPLIRKGTGNGLACRAQAETIGAELRRTGAQALWAEYWHAFRLALLLDERIVVSSFPGTGVRPDWATIAKIKRPAAYLIGKGDGKVRDVLCARAPVACPAKSLSGEVSLLVLPEFDCAPWPEQCGD
jgi:hypothetical protein